MRVLRLILVPLFLSLQVSLFGQIENEAYEKKLDKLYAYSVPLISAEQLAFEREQNPNIVVLDTRQKKEFEVSHLPEARFVDYDKFSVEAVRDIPRDAKVVVYCSVGYRSERIGEKLQKAGYEHVYNLYGGIFEWVNQDNEVVNKAGIPTQTVHTYNKLWSQWLRKGEKVW